MERLIAVDPGVNFTGFAFFIDGELETVTLSQRLGKSLLHDTLADHATKAIQVAHAPTRAVIERPVIYPDSPARDSDQMDLSLIAGAVAGALACVGADVVFATPREWKGTVPKKIHNKRILALLPDLRSMLKTWPKGKHEHMIDAAGLGLWAIGRRRE
jgi:hypothetical protein